MLPGLEIMAVGLTLVAGAAAPPAWCQPEAPKIEILPRMDPVQIEHAMSHMTLRNFATIEVSPYGQMAETVHQGLARPNISAKYNWLPGGTIQQGVPDPQMCLWYQKIKVDLSLSPKIYIASEIPAGTCTYREVLAHERRHVAVTRKVVNKYAKLIGQAILADLKAHGFVTPPAPAASQLEVQGQLDRRMERIVKTYFDAMEKEHEMKQNQVDTLEEYQRVDAACPDDPNYIQMVQEKAAGSLSAGK